jgi:hypothetical protein
VGRIPAEPHDGSGLAPAIEKLHFLGVAAAVLRYGNDRQIGTVSELLKIETAANKGLPLWSGMSEFATCVELLVFLKTFVLALNICKISLVLLRVCDRIGLTEV